MAFNAGTIVGDLRLGVAKFKKGVSDAKKHVSGFTDKFKKMSTTAKLAWGAVGSAVAITGKEMLKTGATIKSTKGRFDDLTKSIDENANVMLKDLRRATKGTMSDLDLMTNANKLMMMGLAESKEETEELFKIVKKLKAPTEDMSTSMENFALMLANQSIERLDSFGISSGKVRKRIEELMEANTDMSRETAFLTATLEDAKGKMAILKDENDKQQEAYERVAATIANVKNKMSELLIDGVDKLIYGFSWLREKFKTLPEPVQKLAKYLGIAAAAFGGLITVVGILGVALPILTAGFSGLVTILGVLTSPITLIIAGIAALYLAWETNFLGLQDISKVVFDWLKEKFNWLIEFLQAYVVPFFTQAWEKMSAAAEKTAQFFTQTIFPAIEKVFKWIMDIIDGLKKKWDADFMGIKTITETIWKGIQTYFANIFELIKGIFLTALALLRGDWGGAMNAMKDTATTIWENIKGYFSMVWENIKSLFGRGTKAIKGAWSNTMDGIRNTTMNVWESIKQGVKKKINDFIGIINSMVSKINNVTGKIGVPSIPKIPELAQGGIVTRPTLAMVGEGGEPEAVVPLSKMGQYGFGGGGGNNFNFYGAVTDKEAAKEMLEEAFQEMRPNLGI